MGYSQKVALFAEVICNHDKWACPTEVHSLAPAKSKGLGKYKCHISSKGIQLGSVYVSIRNRISPEKAPMHSMPGGRLV